MSTIPSQVHIVFTRLLNVDPLGRIVDRSDLETTFGAMLHTSSEPRVIEDLEVPSSAGSPSIKQYVQLEAASGFRVSHIDATVIISYYDRSLLV